MERNKKRRPRTGADPAAEFDRLLRPHIPALYRQAFRWTAARDRAEDLVQELLVRLFPRLEEIAALDRPLPWALRVMYRIFVDQYRREVNSPVRSIQECMDAPDGSAAGLDERYADEAPLPEDNVERELTARRLNVAWQQLGEEHRVVVSMHDIEGYRLEELSGLLDVPVGTLKSRLHRARARLRELLAGEPFAGADRVSPQRLSR
jgi:RNA polymerase sigma factor (sigma-70 family)